MNFFTSVFSDSDNGHQNQLQEEANRDSSPPERRSVSSHAGAWEIGGLWKTLSAKSESIIEIYRRDLQEFGTGLKKEIEVAHGSLETVGNVLDQFGNTVAKGTAHIISHSKDAILLDSESCNNDNTKNKLGTEKKGFNSRRYSRFDAQVQTIQNDVSTYTKVPEDLDGYEKWKSGFSLEGKSEEMEGLLRENGDMESVYKRVVPNVVDHDTFWCRYYYRVYRFKKAEDVRARLVRRMSRQEELSWDVEEDDDDDDEEEEEEEEEEDGDENNKEKEGDSNGTKRLNVEQMYKSCEEGLKKEKKGDFLQSKGIGDKKDKSGEESKVEKSNKEMGDGSKKSVDEVADTGNMNDSCVDSDKKVIMERKVDDEKDSLVANKHPGNEKEEEEDLEWDEIEDLSRIDEEKGTKTGSPTKVDLRKRLSTAQEEEEEDLSWDIEDDDDKQC